MSKMYLQPKSFIVQIGFPNHATSLKDVIYEIKKSNIYALANFHFFMYELHTSLVPSTNNRVTTARDAI